MKRFFILSIILATSFSLSGLYAQVKEEKQEINLNKKKINDLLTSWHEAAAETDFKKYFGLMADDAIFIGTDATEKWDTKAFKEFSKPYFDAGKAWSFNALERNIYLSDNLRIAWFDELLDTHMGICRGSGVLQKEKGIWKINHYVLSLTIPNENIKEITLIKKYFDNNMISELEKN